ncbi:protein of unknown function [Methylocaldum szegediense]|uniref:Uncharacterized protein n=1 Tax=Methylocaldum szegediense TaxID=73780 RepID=A0ABM9HWE9_9GAMM|nr:protein of unknown function [Methylocaldum szegediense]
MSGSFQKLTATPERLTRDGFEHDPETNSLAKQRTMARAGAPHWLPGFRFG